MYDKYYISFLFSLFFIVQTPHCQNSKYKVRTIAFYNVENLFDTIDNPETFDEDFTPSGKNKYSFKNYRSKLNHIGKVISEIGLDVAANAPVIIGLAEIENRQVLEDLILTMPIKDKNYKIVHFDSPDLRGIDVALLYQEKYFTPLTQKNYELKLWDEKGLRIYTRDILVVSGIIDNELIHIIVTHWPSRRGGKQRSAAKREKAAFLIQKIIDAIYLENPQAKILIMGDFNDDPTDKSIKIGLSCVGSIDNLTSRNLFNPMEKMYKNGFNTLGYRDNINLFDQILLNSGFISKGANYSNFSFYKSGIYNPAYLITQKGKYKGYPYRSFQNNNFSGGFSDHFPVYVYLIKKIK